MTEMTIKKWGNSLAVRLPKVIADMINLKQEQAVTMTAEDGKIIITPVQETEYKLDDLLSQCPQEAIALDDEDKAWISDKPMGRELL